MPFATKLVFALALLTTVSVMGVASAGVQESRPVSPVDKSEGVRAKAQEATLKEMCVDGLDREWRPKDLVATDPEGDAEGAFDLGRIWARGLGSRLYLRFEVGRVLNIQSGPRDEGTLIFEFQVGEGTTLHIDLRGRRGYLDGDPEKGLIWREIDFMTAPTFAASAFEMQIDLGEYGAKPGLQVSINSSGSDRLEKSAVLSFEATRDEPAEKSAARAEGSDLRVLSLNTLRDGLRDRKRAASLRRLVEAADADILCFQEEYELRKPARMLSKVLGGRWHAVFTKDCLTASRHPIELVRAKLGRSNVALVRLPKGPVLVINTHPKAAGYIGNKSDRKRITEMQRMADFLVAFREGRFEKKWKKYAGVPMVVAGDWNLVGSRTPLDLIIDRKGPALVDHLLPQLAGSSVATWREVGDKAKREGGFAPGRLDLICSDPTTLDFLGGFVLNSTRLAPATLKKLGLRVGDSEATDHLLLVADFKRRPL